MHIIFIPRPSARSLGLGLDYNRDVLKLPSRIGWNPAASN